MISHWSFRHGYACPANLPIQFQSLQSIATEDEKHYQCQNIVLTNKLDHYFWNSIGEFNHCDGRDTVLVECADKDMKVFDMGKFDFYFVSVAHFELVVLLCDSFSVVPVLGVVQSTKCFMLIMKWETEGKFPPALSEVVCTSIQIWSTSSFTSLKLLPFSQTYLFRVFQKPFIQRYPRVLRNETAETVSERARKTGLNTSISFYLKKNVNS